MRTCKANRGDFPCTIFGCSWCNDCRLYVRVHYKNIEEALKVERPNDEVVKILSNKFAIVRPALIGGGFADEQIMGISNSTTVYSYGSVKNICQICLNVSKLTNIEPVTICYDFPENKRYNVYLRKINDRRKYKKEYRKLSKLV